MSVRLTAPRAAALLVFVAAVALYLPSLQNGFAYDDHVVIRLNEKLHDLGRAHLIFTSSYWPDEDLGLYRPLASLTYAVDWAIAGDNARWFHVVNVAWNAVASVLVLLLLLCFVPLAPAVIGALIFAAHPVHVEAVANVVGRAEVMAATFSFAAMLLWLRAPEARVRAGRAIAIAACYGLAMLSKESAIMLPALIALADAARRALRPANVREWLTRNVVPIAAMAVVALLFLAARTGVLGSLGPQRVDPALDLATATDDRIRTALQAWPHIIRLLIFPRTLLSDYGPRIIMPAPSWTPLVIAGAAILAGLVAGGIFAWIRGRGRLALVLLFLPVALLPVSNLLLPIGVIVAERALYLPSFAAAAAAAFGAAAVWDRRHARAAVIGAAAGMLIFFGWRSLVRIPEWKSTGTIFAALMRDRPDSFRAHWHSARVAANAKDVPLALQRYAATMNLWPYRRNVAIEAANYAANSGDLPFALRLTDFALERWPDNAEALRLRAALALDLADTATARIMVARGLRAEPSDTLLLQMQQAILESGSR